MTFFVRFRKDVHLLPYERPYKTRRGVVRRRWVHRTKPDELYVEFDTRHRLWISESKLRRV